MGVNFAANASIASRDRVHRVARRDDASNHVFACNLVARFFGIAFGGYTPLSRAATNDYCHY